MRWPSAGVIVGCALLAGGLAWLVAERSGTRVIEAGFWFEGVAFESPTLGAPITAEELDALESIARSELTKAFAGLRVTFSDRRDARYRLRLVQALSDPRFRRRQMAIAGESRAIAGLGGEGALSLSFLASGALSCAPPGAGRSTMIEAIGRGVGRTAVHEFTHQFIPTAPIHDGPDIRSYEYASASRCEHYFGDMRWNLAWPLLEARFGNP